MTTYDEWVSTESDDNYTSDYSEDRFDEVDDYEGDSCIYCGAIENETDGEYSGFCCADAAEDNM